MAGNKSVDNDIDALFKLPPADFISARKALAVRLKKEGRAEAADRVKGLSKPSISVWAVNQLYWHHRDEFDRLIAAGQRFRRAHTSRTAKAGELNEALDARRDALNRLSDLASSLLRGGGHNPGLESMRRIATTLEAISAYPVLPDDQALGRLTKDLDPPGFESLAPFIRAVATTRRPDEPAKVFAPNKSAVASTRTASNSAATEDAASVAKARQTALASAKAALKDAKQSLVEARAAVASRQIAQKKAHVEMKNAEKQKREAEQRFRDASAASAAASVRAENMKREAERAAQALKDAERAVAQANKELESLSRQSSTK